MDSTQHNTTQHNTNWKTKWASARRNSI